MKNLFILLVFFGVSFLGNAQFIVTQDTTHRLSNQVTFSYSIAGDLTLIDSLSIHLISTDNGDTLTLFNGVYVVEEDDPSIFELFDFNEDINTINLQLGTYETSTYRATIHVHKLDGILEETIFN
tara:strand:- start:11008 stop:11382 length:375 start_codon:yes stop_codon:yes gene_type:complete